MSDSRFNSTFMDTLGIISFLIGVMNYNENIDQSTLQKTAKNIMSDIHEHLKEQDEKIDYVISMLEGGRLDGVSK